MREYTLFLDESEVSSYNNSLKCLCIAGLIVPSNKVGKLEEKILSLKKSIWLESDFSEFAFSEYRGKNKNPAMKKQWNEFDIHKVNVDDIILHDFEIRNAIKGRGRDFSYPPHFQIFRKATFAKKYYEELKSIYLDDEFELFIIESTVEKNGIQEKYKNNYSYNEFYIETLKDLISKFILFLLKNDGMGNIIIEASNDKSCIIHGKSLDDKCKNLYYNMLGNGHGYFTPNIVQERLTDFKIISKFENNLCLQLADIIPNLVVRNHLMLRKQLYFNYKDIKVLHVGE